MDDVGFAAFSLLISQDLPLCGVLQVVHLWSSLHLISHCMQSVRSGCVFDSLRFLSVSIIRWWLFAVCTQKTEVAPCRKAVQVFDVNYSPPTLSDEIIVLPSAIQNSKDVDVIFFFIIINCIVSILQVFYMERLMDRLN